MKNFLPSIILLTSIILLSTGASFAVDEQYQQNKPLVNAFWGASFDGSDALDGQAIRSSFTGAEGITIETLVLPHPNPKASIVLITGKSESFVKYKELAWEFHNAGFTIYAMDHRSQGLSGRLVPAADKVHVNDFSHYLQDFEQFLQTVVLPENPEKLFLFAHSMGGAITGTYLLDNHDTFDAAILNAPMIRFKTDGVPAWLTELIVSSAVKLGQGESYVLGKRDWTIDEWAEILGQATGSDARFNDFLELVIEYPELFKSEGATNSWVDEGLKFTRKLRKNAKDIKTPIKLFQAEDDAFVFNGDQNKLCNKAAACELVFVPNSKHEIYFDIDSVRTPYLAQVLAFYESFL